MSKARLQSILEWTRAWLSLLLLGALAFWCADSLSLWPRVAMIALTLSILGLTLMNAWLRSV